MRFYHEASLLLVLSLFFSFWLENNVFSCQAAYVYGSVFFLSDCNAAKYGENVPPKLSQWLLPLFGISRTNTIWNHRI